MERPGRDRPLQIVVPELLTLDFAVQIDIGAGANLPKFEHAMALRPSNRQWVQRHRGSPPPERQALHHRRRHQSAIHRAPQVEPGVQATAREPTERLAERVLLADNSVDCDRHVEP